MRGLVVALALLVPRLASADKCVVHGTSVTLHEGTVRPKGEPAFKLGIVDVPASATLPRCGAPTKLNVTGNIELTIERKNVWLNVSRDLTTADGLVTLEHGAQVIDACVSGDRVLATAVTFANDVLPGEDKGGSSFIRNVEIPCDALTLDNVANDDDDFLMPMSPDATEHGFELRNPNRTRVTLRAQPNAKAKGLAYEEPDCTGGCIQLHEIRSQKNWVLVEVGGQGVLLRGWVHRSELKAVPDMGWISGGYMCTGDHAGGGFEGGFGFGTKTFVDREGTVRAGTKIFASTGNGEWARFAKPTHINVRVETGSPWVELLEAPGLERSLNAFIPLDAMTFDP